MLVDPSPTGKSAAEAGGPGKGWIQPIGEGKDARIKHLIENDVALATFMISEAVYVLSDHQGQMDFFLKLD